MPPTGKSLFEPLLNALKISAYKLEKMAGLGNGVIGKAIKNDSPVSLDTVDKIVRAFPEVSETWLRTGEGSILTSSEKAIQSVDQGQFIRDYLATNGYSNDVVSMALNITEEELIQVLNRKRISYRFVLRLCEKLNLNLNYLNTAFYPEQDYFDLSTYGDWGSAVKDWFMWSGADIEELYKYNFSPYTKEYVDKVLAEKNLPEDFIRTLVSKFPEIAIGIWKIHDFPLPVDLKLPMVRYSDTTPMIMRDYLVVKVVPKHKQKYFTRRLKNTIREDLRFIESLPEMLIPGSSYSRRIQGYMIFEMDGNDLNDGTPAAILDSDKVLAYERSKDFLFTGKFDLNVNFVLITKDGPIFTKIDPLSVVKGGTLNLIRCGESKQFTIVTTQIKQIYSIERIVERILIPDKLGPLQAKDDNS